MPAYPVGKGASLVTRAHRLDARQQRTLQELKVGEGWQLRVEYAPQKVLPLLFQAL